MAHSVRTNWVLLAVLGVIVTTSPAGAKFANRFMPVPFERLFANLRAHTEKNPKDAGGYYVLGRLHSLAFARDEASAQVYLNAANPSELPSFPPWESVRQERDTAKPLSDQGVRHLAASVKHYGTSVQLAPQEALYWLGLGWMCEQGVPYAARTPAPLVDPAAVVPKDVWRQKALTAYRKAHALTVEADLKGGARGPGADSAISLEAAEGLIRLLDRPTAGKLDRAEIAQLQATVKRLSMLPRIVTPIIFPLGDTATLAELIEANARVTFDLAGDTRTEQWPWVRPNAGILVWDPKRTGRITSGTQLFGSRTWAMYWRDGYAALASLDDNGDGTLTGRELNGLAVWQDGDGDAESDPGEVRSLEKHGITAVTVTANGSHAGVPWNSRGLKGGDGAWRPTYDWTPTSLGR